MALFFRCLHNSRNEPIPLYKKDRLRARENKALRHDFSMTKSKRLMGKNNKPHPLEWSKEDFSPKTKGVFYEEKTGAFGSQRILFAEPH